MNADARPRSVLDLPAWKAAGQRLVMLTCYDAAFARLLDRAEVDVLLVGDSLNQVIAGQETTLSATLDQMIYHAAAVRRGAAGTLLFVDLPFLTYQVSVPEAIRNAGRVLQETEANGVKLEGGRHMAETVRALVERGIPVMGHLGLTPQSVHALGGYKVQGRDPAAAERLLDDAKQLEAADLGRAHHSDDRDRSWAGVRRTGAGAARHAGAQRRILAQVPQALCRARRRGARRGPGVRYRRACGDLPGTGAQL
jgi:ketopantoate hydroxymethyltransferase